MLENLLRGLQLMKREHEMICNDFLAARKLKIFPDIGPKHIGE